MYTRSGRELESLVELVRVTSRNISLKFGLEKCAEIAIKNGIKDDIFRAQLPDGRQMAKLI